MKRTVIISGFPGIGKSTLLELRKDLQIADSDSSKFSHTYDENGNKIVNPDFPMNYMSHIKSLIGKVDIILVSTHEEIRNALVQEEIPFNIIYPSKKLKAEYVGRYYLRKSPETLINKIADSFYEWIDDIDEMTEETVHKFKIGEYGAYLSDIIKNILDM